MGGDLIRFHLDWSRLMPDAFMRVDQSYQDRVDQVMAWAAAHRVKVILNLVGTPCWAPASGPSCPLSHEVMFSAPRPDIFQATTRYLLQRYPSLYAFEVWNEPNLGGTFWVGSPAEFAATVNAAVAGANEAGVGTKVLAGGLFMDGSSYLQQLYDAGMHGQRHLAAPLLDGIRWRLGQPERPSLTLPPRDRKHAPGHASQPRSRRPLAD